MNATLRKVILIPKIESEKDFDEHFQSPLWLEIAKEICRREKVGFSEIKRAGGSEHLVFLIDEKQVLKIFRPYRNCFGRETTGLEIVSGKTSLKVPEVQLVGKFEEFDYMISEQISGELITRQKWLELSEREQKDFVVKLAVGLKEIHQITNENLESDWAEFVEERAESFIGRQIENGVNATVIKNLPEFIEKFFPLVPKKEQKTFMHADVHFGNLHLLKKNGTWQISGLFDFADSRVGFHEYEFLAVGVLMIQGQKEVQREFFKAYGYQENELDETFRKRLMMLTMLYETADLRRYAMRLRPEAVNYSLDELEKGIWSFV